LASREAEVAIERPDTTGPERGLAWIRGTGTPLVAGALGTALFLTLFGYWGLVHDARLYALQALAWLHPQLRQDLYLRFGSQDDYTLFSALFAPLTHALGLEGAALTLTLLSLLALFTATAYLLARMSDPAGSLAGTLTVAMLPVTYGALSIFHVAEPFATPRPLAAALGLLAVAFALERRALAAVLAAVAGLLIHPLIAWPAVVLALWVSVRPRLAAILTLAGALALFLAAWAGVPVLTRLFQTMDPEWKAMTSAMAPYLWTATWEASDWHTAGIALLSPLVAAARLHTARLAGQTAPERGYIKLALAASLLASTGLVATAVLGDGFDNLLSLQLQPWRALWLAHWLGVASLGLLCVRYTHTRDPADLIACLGLAGAELLITSSGTLILVVTLVTLYLYGRNLSATANRLLLVMMAAIFALGLTLNLLGAGMHGALDELLLQQSAVVMLMVLCGWVVLDYVKTPRVRYVGQAAILVLSGILAVISFQRSLTQASSNAAIGILGEAPITLDCLPSPPNPLALPGMTAIPPSTLGDILPRNGSILWEGTPFTLWYQLHYPIYMNILQLTGSVFSREKLMAARARIAHMEAVLGPLGLINRESESLDLPPPDAQQIERLCADPQLAGIYYAGKQELPGPAAGAGAEDYLTLRNANGIEVGVLALCPGESASDQ
jgi:hypothetical protein